MIYFSWHMAWGRGFDGIRGLVMEDITEIENHENTTKACNFFHNSSLLMGLYLTMY